MITTIILCLLGLTLIGVGGYLWYRRHIEDESSFGHDDVRWEQIDADHASSVKKAVSDIDQLTTIGSSAQDTDGSSPIETPDFVMETLDDDLDEELDQIGKLLREHDEPADQGSTSSPSEEDDRLLSATVSELKVSPDKSVAQAKLADDPEMVISVHVVAKPGREFHGDQLFEAFDQVGLRHGDRDIFHFYDSEQDGGPIRFSAANMVEPGTFNPNNMNAMKTNGVTLFMLLPGQNNNVKTFENLLDTGDQLAKRLGGELRDSQRSTLTSQGANLIKESIHQFYSRRQLKQGQLNL